MRASANRHPVAILREVIGLGQKELAALLECSPATVQSVELGRLKLSQELAQRISLTTGVSVSWLLDGDPTAPIVNRNGDPYTVADFEKAKTGEPDTEQGELTETQKFTHDYLLFSAWLFEIIEKARTTGKGDLATFKVRNALHELAAEFGAELELVAFMPRRLRDMMAALSIGADTAVSMFETLEADGSMDKVREAGTFDVLWKGHEHHQNAPANVPRVKMHNFIPPKGYNFYHPNQPDKRDLDKALRKREK